ncbi:RNA-binding S4 domain-containing protein [Porphyromonadaceae bacterium OttesenSCG-928-L07]|nr:RNA-binding S4 domain-containing protein [Porphyromonadaceae bacterium OttesenSCG-928-L07]MDL2252087.1 RNA-binding S4 domain-containing protein [Odoribacter sp. OttesenSCG-928-J03]MDL2330834.1 RNA-binding S4 domain-containing protein [Odoribacter sp. OttesenSCG-928-A06]
MDKVRIDKWLWAVRIFKTRSIAAEECNKGHVSVGDQKVKPSREIRVGDVVKVRMAPIERSYKVKQLSEKRMSASLAVDFVEDITPPEMYDLLNAAKAFGFERRDRGIGRPTKRDRRMIDKLKSDDLDV